MKKGPKVPILTGSILMVLILLLFFVSEAVAPTDTSRDTVVTTSFQLLGTSLDPAKTGQFTPEIKLDLAWGAFDPLTEPTPDPMWEWLLAYNDDPYQEHYYIVQFDRPITEMLRDALIDAGARVFDYLPDFSFIVKMDDTTRTAVEAMESVRWVGLHHPLYKIEPKTLNRIVSFEETASEEFIITTFPGEDPLAIADQIEGLGGEVLDISENGFGSKMSARLDIEVLEDVTQIEGVKWIEPAPVWKLFNDAAAGIMAVPNVWNDHTLCGSGQVVGVADTGLDQGDTDPANLHNDFENGAGASRVSQIFDRVGDGADDVRSGHGTHVAGSVLGNGSESGSNPPIHDYDSSYAGMAPEATLVFQAVENNTTGSLQGIPIDLNELFGQARGANARIHTNSWGASQAGDYTSFSEDVDQFMWNNKEFLILFSAGNDGVDANDDGVIDPIALGSPATAKNCITVGATENNRPSGSVPSPGFNSNWGTGWPNDYPVDPITSDHVSNSPGGMAAFSSRGPCLDGRIKPDIVTPGTNIISTKSSLATGLWGQGGLGGGLQNDYVFSGGTSMSTPLVAGAAALAREFYTDVEGVSPSAALIKATLLNGAAEITPGQHGTGAYREIPEAPRPNNVEGWGRLDLETSIFPAAPKAMKYQDETPGLTTGQTHIYNFDVADGAVPLKVTLVWTDYPGSPAAGGNLVNDLDLILVDPDAAWHYPNNASQRGQTSVTAYDDEGYDTVWRFSGPGGGFAVRFTPASYPAVLDKARFFLTASTTAQFRCHVWDDNGAGGEPGSLLFSGDATPPYLPSGGWFTVDISGVTITEGSFYIELRYTSSDPNNPNLCLDQTSPDARSYVFDGTAWSLLPYPPISNGDWAIQAILTAQEASTSSDRVNNVVGIDIATPEVGSHAVRIEAYNIPQGPQPYALVVTGGNLSDLTQAIPPQAPTDLTDQVIASTQVDLSWTDNSADETGFRIERKQGAAGTYAQIDTVGVNETIYSDTTTIGGPTYFYRIKAYNAEGDSASSNQVSVTPGVPDPPTAFSATPASYSQVSLTWTDGSVGETGFRIQRKTGTAGVWAQLAIVSSDQTAYVDTSVSGSTTYYYRCFSYNPRGDSQPSNEASATTPAVPVAGGGGGGGGGCFVAAAIQPLTSQPPPEANQN
jgi:subtilisin family serine protease